MRPPVVFPKEPAKAPAGGSYGTMQILTMQLKSSCFDSPTLRAKARRDGRPVFGLLLILVIEWSHLLKNKVEDVLNGSLPLKVNF